MISSELNGVQMVDCGKQIITNYNDNEKLSIIWYLLEEKYRLNKLQYLSDPTRIISNDIKEKIIQDFYALSKNMPVQHLVGHAYFMGEKYKVSKDVLIPRPETEELVEKCCDALKNINPQYIADICSGSGCISIALSKQFPLATTKGYEISSEALQIANENKTLHSSNVEFIQCDILKENPFKENSMDCIISNPPYVLESEKSEMDKNVLDHEPHLALFVKDNKALIFYSRILKISLNALKPNGLLFFEINEQKGEEIKKEALALGYSNASIIKDIHGKDRIIKVIKG